MSYNRLDDDKVAYEQRLKQSMGVAGYIFDMPQINCNACFPSEIGRQVGTAQAVLPKQQLIDLDSDLMGLNQRALRYVETPIDVATMMQNSVPVADCRSIDNQHSRLSNPPSTLRCQGINRWEMLPVDPQANVELPFQWNIDNRLLAKDAFKTVNPVPINQSASLPVANQSSDMVQYTMSCGPSIDRIQNVRCTK